MRPQKIQELRDLIENFSTDYAGLCEAIGKDPKQAYGSMHGELIMAMLNLSAMDGYLAKEEVYVIAESVGISYNPDKMMDSIVDYGFPNVDYLKVIPPSLQMLKAFDVAMQKKNPSETRSLAAILVDIYDKAAFLLVASDGQATKNEIAAHAIMIGAIKAYLAS